MNIQPTHGQSQQKIAMVQLYYKMQQEMLGPIAQAQRFPAQASQPKRVLRVPGTGLWSQHGSSSVRGLSVWFKSNTPQETREQF